MNAVPVRAAEGEIIHDAENQILQAQHGERWAREDTEIDARLAEIRKKTTVSHPTSSSSCSMISALVRSECRTSMSSAATQHPIFRT
jgi:hypothetical protein